MNNQFPSSRALRTPGCFVQYSIEYLWSSISRTSIYVYDVEEALNKHSEATSVCLDKSFYEIKRARFKGWVFYGSSPEFSGKCPRKASIKSRPYTAFVSVFNFERSDYVCY